MTKSFQFAHIVNFDCRYHLFFRQSAKEYMPSYMWCLRRLLKVPWKSRRSNQSVLREINPEYLLKRQMLKLMLQYFGHLMQTGNSLEKSLMLIRLRAEG